MRFSDVAEREQGIRRKGLLSLGTFEIKGSHSVTVGECSSRQGRPSRKVGGSKFWRRVRSVGVLKRRVEMSFHQREMRQNRGFRHGSVDQNLWSRRVTVKGDARSIGESLECIFHVWIMVKVQRFGVLNVGLCCVSELIVFSDFKLSVSSSKLCTALRSVLSSQTVRDDRLAPVSANVGHWDDQPRAPCIGVWVCRAMCERISGGNLLASSNRFLNEVMIP